jgi:hypothetical protein
LDRALNPDAYEAESEKPAADDEMPAWERDDPHLKAYREQLARQDEVAAKDAELKAAREQLDVAFNTAKQETDKASADWEAGRRLVAMEWGQYFPEIQGGYEGLQAERARDPAAFDKAMAQFAQDQPERFEKLHHLTLGTEAYLKHTHQQAEAAQQTFQRQQQAWAMEQGMQFARAHPELSDPAVKDCARVPGGSGCDGSKA